MNAGSEIAVRTPQLAALQWMGIETFGSRVSEGSRIERGQVLGAFHGSYGSSSTSAEIISPVTGRITFVASDSHRLDDGQLLIRIESETPIANDGCQIAIEIFQNMQRRSDESLTKKRKEVTNDKVGFVLMIVPGIPFFLLAGGACVAMAITAYDIGLVGRVMAFLFGIFMLLGSGFIPWVLKQDLKQSKSKLAAYPGADRMNDAWIGSVSVHAGASDE